MCILLRLSKLLVCCKLNSNPLLRYNYHISTTILQIPSKVKSDCCNTFSIRTLPFIISLQLKLSRDEQFNMYIILVVHKHVDPMVSAPFFIAKRLCSSVFFFHLLSMYFTRFKVSLLVWHSV